MSEPDQPHRRNGGPTSNSAAMDGERPVILARIGAAHGIRGEVRVQSFTEDPLAFGRYGPLFDAAGNRYTVAAARPSKTVIVTRFAEIASREAAEALNGTELSVPRSALDASAVEEDEWFASDLIGLGVRGADGERIGTVAALHDFGAGDIVEIAFGRGSSVMAPFTEAVFPVIDIAAGEVTFIPPAEVSERDGDAADGGANGTGETDETDEKGGAAR